MESPKKFNDCYFYYYSTCTKGDNCVFRHEPAALGCETMCSAWQQGKCLDKRCKLRHMELRKNRKQIPCYWENQPGGCRKKHCPFMHKNPEARTDGIAPSQPAPPTQAQPIVSANETVPAEQQPMNTGVPPAIPAPAPVPLLWQQQRQVVLDSAILGVLPASSDLLGGRRVLPPHAHDGAPNPYAPMPVDPLVVNFEEESDNESAPSTTPTKVVSPDDAQKIARSKSQEILLLEKIQAEAAAFYNYDSLLPTDTSNERKIVRTNLNNKYERLSLDDIANKKLSTGDRRNSLDFKVLSLEEIRAGRKKTSDAIVHSAPITLNLSSRKRKSSTQETITTSGNKIIKVVRSNSIVYKKVDNNITATCQTKVDHKDTDDNVSRKRTLSEQTDIYADIQEDELVDNCFEFKRIKLTEQTSKPRLIRNISNVSNEAKDIADCSNKSDNDSDSEVQIVSIDITEETTVNKTIDLEVIDLEPTNVGEILDIVDLSDDLEETDVNASDRDLDLVKNVPDVVASCRKSASKMDNGDTELLKSIDSLIDGEL